ncbi:MAG: glycosyltransferase family 4 protein [Porphyromonadaceae bacterium]|nr:glycosyltransferase family 4 protein [Porphyromonadaceae bacterium]
MRIVYCIPATSNSGGMERVLARKVNYLVGQGHELIIITTDQKGAQPFFSLEGSVKQYDLGINYDENNGQGILAKLLAYPKKKRLHRQRLSELLGQLRADIVVSMFGDDSTLLPQMKDGSRKVLEYHFSKLKRLQYGRTGLWRLVDILRTKLDERTVRPYDSFVVLTEEDAGYWGALPNIRVIPNPLPFVSDETSPCTSHKVIAVGRYDFQKNFSKLLDLWGRIAPAYPDWSLEIYGDGALRQELELQVNRLGLFSYVTLAKPTHQMKEVYQSASIYAMTSRYEGLPMVLIEAQHMGLPIVSFACPCGPKDVLHPGEDGYLISQGDDEGFLAALRQLMDSETERVRMGTNARKASARYEVDAVMGQWLDLFSSLVYNKSSAV